MVSDAESKDTRTQEEIDAIPGMATEYLKQYPYQTKEQRQQAYDRLVAERLAKETVDAQSKDTRTQEEVDSIAVNADAYLKKYPYQTNEQCEQAYDRFATQRTAKNEVIIVPSNVCSEDTRTQEEIDAISRMATEYLRKYPYLDKEQRQQAQDRLIAERAAARRAAAIEPLGPVQLVVDQPGSDCQVPQ